MGAANTMMAVDNATAPGQLHALLATVHGTTAVVVVVEGARRARAALRSRRIELAGRFPSDWGCHLRPRASADRS
jgi:hypothetical protein